MRKYNIIPKLTPRQLKNFWAKIIVAGSNDCWWWTGCCTNAGYGKVGLGGKWYQATRVMLALKGKRTSKLEVCHSCNHPNCVNPNHLRFGTSKENSHDQLLIGTDSRGSRNGRAKLTEIDIPIIRNLCTKMNQRQIAKIFKISKEMISHINVGDCWTHVKGVATDLETKKYLKGIYGKI